ncbi:MAG: PqqD family protein [Solirubrobacterales bacterium]
MIVEELGDELLVYDLDADNVHALTPIAARVWRACDGATDAPALAGALELSSEDVARAFAELDGSGLLVSLPGLDGAGSNGGLSRRDFGLRVGKVAAAAASAPLIVSIAAPVAAHAQTPSACAALPFTGSCGACNQGGTPTECCCCHGGGAGNPPIGCAVDAVECCQSGLFVNPSHCTEQGGQTACTEL